MIMKKSITKINKKNNNKIINKIKSWIISYGSEWPIRKHCNRCQLREEAETQAFAEKKKRKNVLSEIVKTKKEHRTIEKCGVTCDGDTFLSEFCLSVSARKRGTLAIPRQRIIPQCEEMNVFDFIEKCWSFPMVQNQGLQSYKQRVDDENIFSTKNGEMGISFFSNRKKTHKMTEYGCGKHTNTYKSDHEHTTAHPKHSHSTNFYSARGMRGSLGGCMEARRRPSATACRPYSLERLGTKMLKRIRGVNPYLAPTIATLLLCVAFESQN